MATILFDIEINTEIKEASKGLSSEQRRSLFATPKVASKKKKQTSFSNTATIPEQEEDLKNLSLNDISEAYQEVIDKSKDLLETLSNRSSGLKFEFDPNNNPELASAVGSLFQGINSYITFDMYKKALELDRDLAIEIGEEESGFVR